jgi:hypothetical protein
VPLLFWLLGLTQLGVVLNGTLLSLRCSVMLVGCRRELYVREFVRPLPRARLLMPLLGEYCMPVM